MRIKLHWNCLAQKRNKHREKEKKGTKTVEFMIAADARVLYISVQLSSH